MVRQGFFPNYHDQSARQSHQEETRSRSSREAQQQQQQDDCHLYHRTSSPSSYEAPYTAAAAPTRDYYDVAPRDYYEQRLSSYVVPDSPRAAASPALDPQLRWNVSGNGSILTGVVSTARSDNYSAAARQHIHQQENYYADYARISPFYENDDGRNQSRRHVAHCRDTTFIEVNAPPLTTESDYYHVERCDSSESNCREKRYQPSLSTLKKAPPTAATATAPVKTIEISPGVHLRLRGADETWRAVKIDFFVPCQCFCCDADNEETIFCIQDADYVVCPICKTVSPLEGDCDARSDGGVGLGFTMTALGKIQDEIARSSVAFLP